MIGSYKRALDRELGPEASAAASGRRSGRDPWLHDWPLLLGMALSACLIGGSMAVHAPDDRPAAAGPKMAAAAPSGSAVPGGAVDVGDGGPAGPEPDANADKPKKKHAKTASTSHASSASSAGADETAAGASPGSSGAATTPSGAAGSSGGSGARRGAGRGGKSSGGPGRTPTRPGRLVNVTGTTASFSNGPLSYSFRAPTHAPVVGRHWRLNLGVTRSGARASGTVKVDILFNGTVVGHVATAALRSGRFTHDFDWPERSVGHPLTVKTTVTGAGYQQSFLFAVKVKSAG